MTEHPRLFLASESTGGLRTVEDLQLSIQSGWPRETWLRILASAEAALGCAPFVPSDDFPGRPPGMAAQKNPDFTVCEAAGQRLLRASLAHLLTGRPEFKVSAMAQLKALYDPEVWPDWIDQAHTHFDFKADLRTGMLSQAVGLTYDWLASSLTADERVWVIEGLDRRGIQPYLESLAMNPWWAHDRNNWMTCIVGGLGIAGMALDGEHPDARRLIDLAVEKMESYLSCYGAEGDFNESVGYAGANRLPVAFFQAHRYWSGGKQNRLAETPFPEMCRWVMHTTLPPGRVVSVGDCHPNAPVTTGYVAPVASANQDGILQWFYHQYQASSDDSYQLVSYDALLPEISPEGKVPPYKSFPAHGRLIVSRSDWSAQSIACVVHAKAGREENHEHNDVGQLCVDGFGERLIIDPGSPSGYPADFFEQVRWEYYNASIRGHNVLMFDGEEQRSPQSKRGQFKEVESLSGHVVAENYIPGVGAAWKMDLSPAYHTGQQVTRTVLHLYPGYVLVLDEAVLAKAQNISLRWHTCDKAVPDETGNFVVRGQKAILAGLVTRLDFGAINYGRREQQYHAPYDRDRVGELLEARRESYIETTLQGDRCRLLTLMVVQGAGSAEASWSKSGENWHFGDISARMTASGPEILSLSTGQRIALT